MRGRRSCEGYDKYNVFIIRTTDGLQKRKPLDEAKPRRTLTKTGFSINGDRTTPEGSQLISGIKPEPISNPDDPSLEIAINTVPVFLRRAESLFMEYWVPLNISRVPRRSIWFATIVSRGTRSSALEASMKALTLTRLGRMTCDDSLVRLGSTAYGIALQELQKALYDKDLMWDDDTLAAGRVCVQHEVLESTSNSTCAWSNHENGMAQLVRLRGASKHKTGLAHDIFLGVRFSSMIHSLQHCKASVLSPRQREWDEEPWAIHPKDENQRLFDYGFTLAAILEDLVSCKKPGQDRVEVGKKMFGIVPRIYELGQDMDDWYVEHFSGNLPPALDSPSEAGHTWNIMQSSLYDDSIESVTSSTASSPPNLEKPQSPIVFKDYNEAETISTYWGVRSLLSMANEILIDILPRILSSLGITGPAQLTPPPHLGLSNPSLSHLLLTDWKSESLSLAGNIMQGTEYLLRDEMKLLGPQSALFPLRVAMVTLQRLGSPLLLQCQRLYERLEVKAQIGYARDLRKARFEWQEGDTYMSDAQPVDVNV